jgi:hypothetical protein
MTLQLGEDPPARDDIDGLVAERSRVARSLLGGRAGGHDPAARLGDMDADGVDADVILWDNAERLYGGALDKQVVDART